MNGTIRLLVACHKPCAVPNDPMYLPVFVGAAGKEEIPGFTRDDTGENISTKNPYYSELTALYWGWKNLDCDYIGLVHYRRLFAAKRRTLGKQGLAAALTTEEAEALLEQGKILLPRKRRYYIETLYSHYAHTHAERHLQQTRRILEERSPGYLRSFDTVLRQRSGYFFNMYLMPKALSDAYCAWLFPLLEALEEEIAAELENATPFEKRIPGRISELLLNVWLEQQIQEEKIRREALCEVSWFYDGKVNHAERAAAFLKAKFLGKKYGKSF